MSLIYMPRFVIDAYAWIEYFLGSEKGIRIREIIEASNNEIFTSVITIAEVVSITKRENKYNEDIYNIINNLSTVYLIDPELAKETGLFHAEIRKKIKDFGMTDCVVLLTARKLNAKILTGDAHFKDFKEAILI